MLSLRKLIVFAVLILSSMTFAHGGGHTKEEIKEILRKAEAKVFNKMGYKDMKKSTDSTKASTRFTFNDNHSNAVKLIDRAIENEKGADACDGKIYYYNNMVLTGIHATLWCNKADEVDVWYELSDF